MVVSGTTTTARVKPSNEGGNISNEAIAGGWDRCRGMNDNRSNVGGDMWSSNDNRCIVMVCLRESYSKSMSLGSLSRRSRISGVGTGNGSGSSNGDGS